MGPTPIPSSGPSEPERCRVITAGELSRRLEADISGDPDRTVVAVRPPENAAATDLAYIASDRKVPADLAAGVLLLGVDHPATEIPAECTVLRHENPHLAFARAIGIVHPPYTPPPGIDPSASIDPTATIGEGCAIAAHVTVGPDVTIGDGVRLDAGVVVVARAEIGAGSHLHSNVTIYPNSRIGNCVVALAGAVIGSDGFGFVPTPTGPVRVPHVGGVVIGDGAEIGANSTIDRGALEDTVIGPLTKIDNLVHIAHNCIVGTASIFAAQVGIAGSTRIGNGVQFGGQSGAGGHLEVGDNCRIAARGGLVGDVPAGSEMMGFPATLAPQARRSFVTFAKLPEFRKQVEELLRKLEANPPRE